MYVIYTNSNHDSSCVCGRIKVLHIALALAESGGERAWSLGEAYAPEALQAEEEDGDVIRCDLKGSPKSMEAPLY